MKIALIGYGKMGKTIEELALQRGHEIVARITRSNTITALDFQDVDVAIEFTAPHFAVQHIEKCIENDTPVVVGTTAWNDHLDYIKDLVSAKNGTLLYASNFSVGVNIFFDINRRLAKLMTEYDAYKAVLEETHHLEKLDSPSGTAVTLANDIMFANPKISSWVHEDGSVPHTNSGQLGVVSYREENVPGTHKITYTSEIDTIEISHTAHNRKGFALGAVIAAEWLIGKKGVYTMQDVIKFEE
jgi:4-hydroxy-tetrahydrodipicolinate reductase